MALFESSKHPEGHTSPSASYTHDEDFQRIDPESGVKRGLKTRHLSMMALAGIIGPGILVGTGGALSNGGPAALLIGFGIVGIIAWSITQSLGEMTTLYPTGGAFITLSERFVDKAFGVSIIAGFAIKAWLTEVQRLHWAGTIGWFGAACSPTNTMSSPRCCFSGATRFRYGDTSSSFGSPLQVSRCWVSRALVRLSSGWR
jgi:amino acid permease